MTVSTLKERIAKMTKQEILDYFKDINEVYNDCTRFETLSRMLDELLKEQNERIEKGDGC